MIKISANTFSKRRPSALLPSLLLVLLSGSACGKIGPLTLSERPLPAPISDIVVEQRQSAILIDFVLPRTLKDGKTPLEPGQIKYLELWHSTQNADKAPFEKTAKRIRRLGGDELPDPSEGRYTLSIPFPPQELDSQSHYFALDYRYQGKKAGMSQPVRHQAVLPAQAISDLKLLEEGRHFILKWSRPTQNILGQPLKELIGYQVYSQKKNGQHWSEEQRISEEAVLEEGFEKERSDIEGDFRFRVTALSARRIESDFSNAVEISIVDTNPPRTPSGLVCLSYTDHIILTWDPSTEKDFDQYRIFRRHTNEPQFSLLAEGVKTPYYRDYKARKGRKYHYLITAMDEKGNESGQSNIAEGQIE